jgi:hypothetical protein
MRDAEPSPKLVWQARFAERLRRTRPGVDMTLARLYAECAWAVAAQFDAERAADGFFAAPVSKAPTKPRTRTRLRRPIA